MILGSRMRFSVWVVTLAVTLAGCTGPQAPKPEPVSTTNLTRHVEVYTAGFRNISEKYIRPLQVDDIAIGGLEGLTSIDPSLQAERRNDNVRLLLAGQEIASAKAPDAMDARGWGTVTANFEQTARRQSSLLNSAGDEKIYEAVFDGVLADLDVFSRYAGAAEAKRNRARREGFGGIGIRLKMVNDNPVVIKVRSNTPAERAGIKVGDEIIRIDDTDVHRTKLRDLVNHLRGPAHSDVSVRIYRTSKDQHFDFTIARQLIVPNTVTTQVDKNIGYIKISSFNQATAEGVAKALRKVSRMADNDLKGLIVDLRGNPGGLLKQSVKVADLLLTHGQIVSTRGRHPDSLHHYEAGGRDLAEGLPIVVLVDGKSASASEIVAAALQDRRRAVVVGTSSFGKGTVQTVVRLPNDGEVALTWSRFITPSGYALHGLGVRPAVCTSGLSDGPRAALDRFERNKPEIQAAYASWRRSLIDEKESRKALRQACASERRKSAVERRIAELILSKPRLYAQAIELTGRESQAWK